jgi:peptide/nickel transport system substrate-binding protein
MLNLRYTVRLTLAFIKRFRGILLLGVGIGALIFALVTLILPLFLSRGTQRIGITGRYKVTDLPASVVTDISEGLTTTDASGQVLPALATNWEVTNEGKTWIFHLSQDKYWQDGKKVTAEAVNYNFEGVTVEKPDETTIVFTLKDPFSPFGSVVSTPVFKKGLLGTGKWKVTNLSLVSGYVERMTLKDKEGNKKIIKFYPTEDRTKLAFKLGEVDILKEIIDPQPLSDWKTAQVDSTVNQNRFVALFFNTKDPSLNKDQKELRQALSYGIDKTQFEGDRALGPISPNSWTYNSQIKAYDYDPIRAKELLAKLPDEARESINIKISTTSVLLPIAEKIINDWEEIGIKSSVQVVSTFPQEYQTFLAIYDIPKDPDQYATWHSTQKSTNISKYENPRIDKLLEDGRLELDTAKRKKIYLDFQRYLLEDIPAVFLYHPLSYTVTRK